MTFNPLEHKGIPVADQVRSWRELNVDPLHKYDAHPYTKSRVIVMNGIEVESILFSHQFARNTDNSEILRALALSRRIESQQQRAVNWLLPGDETALETTIAYEQVAVDLTAWLARSEPDPYLRQVLEFGLLEDFDHLYRYSNLYQLIYGKRAEELTRSLTEILPGRAAVDHHRHPFDDLRNHYDQHSADILSKLHTLTITAAEQQTMNYYMNVGPEVVEPLARGLYLEIAEVEEQHVSHYESLMDPNETWLQRLVLHEYNECYLYHSFLEDEVDPRVKNIWELHLNMEIGQLHVAADLLRRYEGRDAEEILPKALPTGVRFEPNKEYVRSVLAEQVRLNADGSRFVPIEDLPKDHRYFEYNATVNGDYVPTEVVIAETRAKLGKEYRDATLGDHPVVDLREPQSATAGSRRA